VNFKVLAGILVAGALVYLLAPILTPFLLAFVVTYFLRPLVLGLEARGLGRSFAVALSFSLVLLLGVAVLAFLIPVIHLEIQRFHNDLPGYKAWFEKTALPYMSMLPRPEIADLPSLLLQFLDEWGKQVGSITETIINAVSKGGKFLLTWVFNFLLALIVSFYLLRDGENLLAPLKKLLPGKTQKKILRFMKDANIVLAGFLRGQLTVMLTVGVLYSVGLSLVGVHLAVPLGLLAGAVSFIPYLGFAVGIISALIISIVQFTDIQHPLFVILVFAIVQTLEGVYLTPRFVGERIGLHPVIVLFSLLAFGELFGFAGLLIALPASAVLAVAVRSRFS